MSYDVFAELATDLTLETEGTWRNLGKGARLLVARANNKAYAKLLAKSVERNQQALDADDDAANDLSDEIMIDVIAQTVLLGWEGISFKGADMPYSVENAKKLLAVKDFRARVMGFSNDFEAYRLKAEAAAGNV